MDARQRALLEELLAPSDQKSSLVKLLFTGRCLTGAAFPFPHPSLAVQEETARFMEKLRPFLTHHLDPAAIDRQAAIPDFVIRELGELGLLGLTIPKEYGGGGGTQYQYCQAMAALAARCSATALFVNAHQSIGLRALLLFGSEEQKRRWLPGLARGEYIAAFALTEPNAGSDAAAIETEAHFDEAKGVWVLNGEKQWITNGGIADVLTVMAKTDNKITAFLVTPDMPGFFVRDVALDKVGMRGSKTANLRFSSLEVPKENVLGEIGAGLRICLTVLDYGRTTFGATCVGPGKLLYTMAKEHASTRQQFGKPLSAFPLIEQKVQMIGAKSYAMEATTELTAQMIDRGVEEFMLESAILKVFCSEALWEMIYETMQIFGGRSFFTTLPLERMMRDARLNMIGEGANEVLRLFIAGVGLRTLGLQLQAITNASLPFSETWKLLRDFLRGQLKAPVLPVYNPTLQTFAKKLAKRIRAFARTSAKLLQKHRESITEEQLLLNEVASEVIALYTSIATLSKLSCEINPNPQGIHYLQWTLKS